jgi:hypothetical protein
MRKTTLLGIAAALLAFISTFLPVVSGVSDNFWGSGVRGVDEFKNLMIFFMLCIGFFAFLSNKKHLAAIGTLLASLILFTLAFLLYKAAGVVKLEPGTGLYLLLASSVLGIVSSVLGFMKK